MITGLLTSTLRPVRIEFVIPPWDRAGALEAIRISSFFWGGTYNTIIAVAKRGWKTRLRCDPAIPLINLTGNELFSSTEPWEKWEKLGGNERAKSPS